MSEAKSNLYGVPQGSILGPIFFNIFITDIPKINSLPEITTSTTIYADDVQLLFSGTPNNLELLEIYAEISLKTMKEWCKGDTSRCLMDTFFIVPYMGVVEVCRCFFQLSYAAPPTGVRNCGLNNPSIYIESVKITLYYFSYYSIIIDSIFCFLRKTWISQTGMNVRFQRMCKCLVCDHNYAC